MATAKALQVRKRGNIPLWEPVAVYDLAERLGVDMRFIDVPSMEGAYCMAEHPTIIVSSLRPPGRQFFTGAHELGHHIFGHGDQYDEFVDGRQEQTYDDPDEFAADCFAGALLMPKIAVDRAFSLRNWDPKTCRPENMYVVATYLGVGYTTLIHHMQHTFGTLNTARVSDLIRTSAQSLRASLLGQECSEYLVVADIQWTGRAIDVKESDFILLPSDTIIEGNCAMVVERTADRTVVRATQSGIGRVYIPGTTWASFIRVTRKNFVGRGKYRFLEDVGDGE
jgi:Zn-dependent peptidase ImmA (M78 family)